MKTTIIDQTPGFKPVTIALTFESQVELNAFAALFNFGPVNDALADAGMTGDVHELIFGELVRHGAEYQPAWADIDGSFKKWSARK